MENMLPVNKWNYDNDKDKELCDLIPILNNLKKVADVRMVIRKISEKVSKMMRDTSARSSAQTNQIPVQQ
jgi:TFIIF-interacting CTD phosphatase-like protein